MTGSGGASGVTIEDLRRFWGSTFRLRLKSQLLDTLVLKSPLGFPGGLNGKEAACNVREPDLIPGRSPGEGNGYSSILAGESHDRRAWQATVHGVREGHD